MTDDALFAHIERHQGTTPWGSVLDAGTGMHSLRWIAGLETERWTAVTASEKRARSLKARFKGVLRPKDEVVVGLWTNPRFMNDQVFDVVIADYLLGAIDGFTPFFQDQLFPRLKPLVGQRLYLVGLEPYPDTTEDPRARVILEIARARDACYLLSWGRPYREYPMDWVCRHLEQSGFVVESATQFPNILGRNFIKRQLEVARSCLADFPNRKMEKAMREHLA